MSIFSHVKIRKNKRRNFNLGHEVKFTTDFGKLIPIYWNYFEPTSVFQMRTEIMCRVAPMLAPLMHRVNVHVAGFKVPLRLVMNEFEDMITGGPDGTLEPPYPKITVSSPQVSLIQSGSLADYIGVPFNGLGDYTFDLPAFTAYQLIWNEYFRDPNLQDEINLDNVKTSGIHNANVPSHAEVLKLRNVCWEKDYFTSALPFAQRGEPVKIPGSVDMSYLPYDATDPDHGPTTIKGFPANPATGERVTIGYNSDADQYFLQGGQNALMVDNSGQLRGSINATINDLRLAQRVQRWLERNAVGGARYVEQILAHFPGARNLDARLQRPEYLGGGRVPLVVSEVLQTSEATEQSAQGTMAGRGVANGIGSAFKTKMDEHCIVMVLLWIRPKSAYQQGLPRKLQINNKFDFPWPEFGNLGEQEVLNSEIYYNPSLPESNDETFGYQSRYAQYKYEPNRVHGAFKDTLNFWHLGRIFGSTPVLNGNFVSLNDSNLYRIFAVENDGVLGQDLNHFWFQIYNNIKVNRPLPYYGTPL